LLKFVQYSGEFTSAAVNPGDISAALDTVNRFRIDAHAKDISEADLQVLNNAFDLLDDVFMPPA
jgi:hypothetical protein